MPWRLWLGGAGASGSGRDQRQCRQCRVRARQSLSPRSTRRVPVEYPVVLPRTRRVPVEYPWAAPLPFAQACCLVCAQRRAPSARHAHACDRLLGLGTTSDGRRNTALHAAAASKSAHARAAMVSFLIAERADVNRANKKGCAAQRGSEQGGRADARITPCWESRDQRIAVRVAGTRRCTVRR